MAQVNASAVTNSVNFLSCGFILEIFISLFDTFVVSAPNVPKNTVVNGAKIDEVKIAAVVNRARSIGVIVIADTASSPPAKDILSILSSDHPLLYKEIAHSSMPVEKYPFKRSPFN